MASMTDEENETSWPEKCRILSDRVVVLERKLLAMENLQQLVREKDEESKRLKNVIHQYSWALQWSEHQLRGVTQNSTAGDDRRLNSNPNDTGHAKGMKKTRASMSIDEDPKDVHSLPEGALYGACTPFGLDALQLCKSQEQPPLSPSPIPDVDSRTNSEPIFFMQKSPVSKDLVDKLMQQNARLKKALKVVLTSRETTTNNSLELGHAVNRHKQQTGEHTYKHAQKRMRLWDKTKPSNKNYSCLSLQTNCFDQKDHMPDGTEDTKDCKGHIVQMVPNSNKYSSTLLERQQDL